MLRRYTVVFGVLALALASGEPCFSTTYNITDLGLLPGGVNSVAYGVNNAGEVVGYSDLPPQALSITRTRFSGAVARGC